MASLPLKWHGGKHYLADRIIGLMPPHTHYVEPFAGGLAVLFRKPCDGVSEVVNDLHWDLVNFWSVLRSDELFPRFVRKAEATPFCQGEWDIAGADLEHADELDAVDAALAFFVRYRQSRQGLGKCFATLSRNRTRRGMNEQVSSWLSAIEGLPEAHERLRRVVVLNGDALDVIRQQDGASTLFYCDPPYLHATRTATDAYEYELSDQGHSDLLSVLTLARGKFILSGYHSEKYDGWAARYGFRCVEVEIDNKASGAAEKRSMTECLWMNF